WIAGEDHDFAEINHIHIEKEGRLHKHHVDQEAYLRTSISNLSLDHAKVEQWLREAFLSLQETTHTKSIHETIMTCLGRASTYVDFFAQLIFQLFPKSGLVLIDSAHGEIRKMEGAFFKQFIEKERAVSAAVYETTQSIQQSGYTL